MAPHSSTLAWKIPWTEEPGRLQAMGVTKSRTWLSDFPFPFHFHALEKEMATHSNVLAWRIPGTEEPGGLQSMGSHRVGHDWCDLAAAAAAVLYGSNSIVSFMDNSWPYHVIPKKHKLQNIALSVVSIRLCLMPISLDIDQLAMYFLRKENKSF